MATAVHWEEDDEWELINDDGFVYKRKKRPRLDPMAITASAQQPPSDPALEEKNRQKRKKTALLKLKERYQREIHQWEHLSNTLSDMQQKSTIARQQQPQEISEALTSSDHLTINPGSPVQLPNSTCRRLVDELLSQAEAQEAIIQNVSNLCDIAEVLCGTKEERFIQLFTELPIWESSPRELIKSLCED